MHDENAANVLFAEVLNADLRANRSSTVRGDCVVGLDAPFLSAREVAKGGVDAVLALRDRGQLGAMVDPAGCPADRLRMQKRLKPGLWHVGVRTRRGQGVSGPIVLAPPGLEMSDLAA